MTSEAADVVEPKRLRASVTPDGATHFDFAPPPNPLAVIVLTGFLLFGAGISIYFVVGNAHLFAALRNIQNVPTLAAFFAFWFVPFGLWSWFVLNGLVWEFNGVQRLTVSEGRVIVRRTGGIRKPKTTRYTSVSGLRWAMVLAGKGSIPALVFSARERAEVRGIVGISQAEAESVIPMIEACLSNRTASR